jgi:MoaA/NifB/PqqE/SkfB family radical SAM enzyme
MDMETFSKAIDLVRQCVRKGTQRELNLFGVGEPTLNKNLVEMVRIARNNLPIRGNTMTHELAYKLKDAGITAIDITGHNPRSMANTVRIFRKIGIQGNISMDFALNPNTWAGQVDWFHPEYHKQPNKMECPWLNNGQVMIMNDGRITPCCIDAFATNIIGNVDNKLEELFVSAGKLCETCHHIVPY